MTPGVPAAAPLGALAAPRPGGGKALYLGLGAGAVALAGIGIAVALGGSGGGAGSKDELVRATIAATAAGDIDKLVELGGIDTMLGAVSCSGDKGGNGYGGMPDAKTLERQMRNEMRDALKDLKKLPALEVVRIEDRDEPRVVVRDGEVVGEGCVGKTVVTEYRLKVTVRATADGKSRENTVKMKALEIDGRWTLSDAPDLGEISVGGAIDDAVDKFRGFRDRMCACKDTACSTKVSDDMNRWTEGVARTMKDAKPSDTQMKAMTTLSEELAACMSKIQ